MISLTLTLIGIVSVALLLTFAKILLWVLSLRRVVNTNEVHIVQRRKETISYGKDTDNGNVYYEFPPYLPFIGVTVRKLPVSNFSIELGGKNGQGYEAYDKDRVPFVVDVVAFFCINNANVAAQRVESFMQLEHQLRQIVEDAVRSIMAKSTLHEIMEERTKFGIEFTKEIQGQLSEWGVKTVKSIGLMDVRDTQGGCSIKNIMAMKESDIESQSRITVANNQKKADIAEIEAERETSLTREQALQQVGQRQAEKTREVGVADEQALQMIKEQQALTKEKDMAVLKVEVVRQAEIQKEKEVVDAERVKQTEIIRSEGVKKTDIIRAEGDKEKTVIIASGHLEAKLKEAEGISAEGTALAAAEKAMNLARITPEIELAREVGENPSYQTYLVDMRKTEAQEKIGIEQAKALHQADVKIIANTGSDGNQQVSTGLNSVMNLFTPSGGTALSGMASALMQNEDVQKLIGSFTTPQQPTPTTKVEKTTKEVKK